MAEQSEIVEGSWADDKESDISYNWVTKMSDIQLIEQGINVLEFAEKISKRNPDMEFRVRNIGFIIITYHTQIFPSERREHFKQEIKKS